MERERSGEPGQKMNTARTGGESTRFQVKSILTQSRDEKKRFILLKIIYIDTNHFF